MDSHRFSTGTCRTGFSSCGLRLPLDRPQQAATHAEETPQTPPPPGPDGCGDSREHVGWFLYPRVKTSRRRVFKGAHPSPKTTPPAEAGKEPIHPATDATLATTPEPKTDTETHG
jgi:hypothetical protein